MTTTTLTISMETLPMNFVRAMALAEIAETMFLTRLFEVEPQWRARLSEAPLPQADGLTQALRQAVAELRQLGDFAAALNEIGTTPAGGGVCEVDYEAKGARFIARLERSPEQALNSDRRERWQRVFRRLAELQHAITAAA